jgi:hypothetical protein
MDMKRLAIGTIAGGVTLYLLGYLIFNVAFGPYYAANVGAATNALREPTLEWASALGGLAFGALITYVILNSAGTATIASGFIKGAVTGFLAWLSVDLVLYGATNLWNFPIVVVDPLLEFVHSGIGGAVIAAVLTRVPKSAGVQPAA